jgi:3-oxoacyl-[acyl-carrier-protein] synthase-3
MGARIEAVATSRSRRGPLGRGAIRLADEAAQACLRRAGREARELDFLINAGLYRDRNLGEPAMAAIIQEDIHANPDPPLEGGHGTFSLDVANGACGVLNGAHVLDGFLASGAIALGMVVAADADPHRYRWRTSRFPYDPIGGALLLSRSEDDAKGFTRFSFTTYPDEEDLYEGVVAWEAGPIRRALGGRLPGVRPGRNVLHVQQRSGYADRCAACAAAAARHFLAELGLGAADLDLLLPNPLPASFAEAIARQLGVPPDRVARVEERLARCHTAGPMAALEGALRSGRLAQARNALFVTAGAGISVGLALYRP